ncbi:MAG: GNAT family N-acetyltransferase [Saprospiraceae bacterium]
MNRRYLFETDRLKLRQFGASDAHWFFQLNNDPEVIKYTGDPPFESIHAAEAFLRKYDQYEKYGYGRWAVVRKDGGEVIGWCGLRHVASMDETDIGFRFFRKFWGRGYATESAAACLDYGFGQLGLHRIIGRAMELNMASIRVLEKIGMRKVGPVEFEEHPGVLFEMKRENWQEGKVSP